MSELSSADELDPFMMDSERADDGALPNDTSSKAYRRPTAGIGIKSLILAIKDDCLTFFNNFVSLKKKCTWVLHATNWCLWYGGKMKS